MASNNFENAMLELAQLLMSMTGFGVPLGLVLVMSGRVKFRNEQDTLTRSVAAFCLALVCYWFLGYGLFHGHTVGGIFGFGSHPIVRQPRMVSANDLRFIFLFTLPSIMVTTAMAERGSFTGGNVLAVVVALLVVPVVAHWAWAEGEGWLNARGFNDEGGAVVIFMTAAGVGLASSASIGPRMGHFPMQAGIPDGHNPTFHVLGMIAMVCTLATLSSVQVDSVQAMPAVFLNVLLGACFASISALLLLVIRRSKGSPHDLMTAGLAGAVALLAFSSQAQPANAALVGMFAGVACMAIRRMLLVVELDDPGDMIAGSMAGGLLGGLLVPVVITGSSETLINQVVIQVIGLTAIALWSFGVTFIAAFLINQVRPLRVSDADETRGLSWVHFAVQSEPDLLVTRVARGVSQQAYGHSGVQSEFSRLSNSFSQCVIRLRNETQRAAERIQATCSAQQAAPMLQRIRLAEDTLRVKSEDILLLLESVLTNDRNQEISADFRRWIHDVLGILMTPTLRDLNQFARHLPLQAEFEALENIILSAADTVANSAHEIELLKDLADAQIEGFFSRDHTCDLAELLNDQSSLLSTLADVSSSPLQIDCPVKEGLLVSGDANAFLRILSLMVEGALNRLSAEHSSPVRLELREHSSGHYVILECLDTGTALSGRQIRAIMDPVSNDKGLEQLGLRQILPLMLVSRLVNATGGELTLSSEHGLGTLVHCRFRRRQSTHARHPSKVA